MLTASAHLQVRVLVVVDAHKVVPRLGGEVRHQAGLAAARGALQQDGVTPAERRHSKVGALEIEARLSAGARLDRQVAQPVHVTHECRHNAARMPCTQKRTQSAASVTSLTQCIPIHGKHVSFSHSQNLYSRQKPASGVPAREGRWVGGWVGRGRHASV